MKAFLIDPFERTVTEVTYSGELDGIYKLTQCNCITAVYLENGDTIYVDDEGLLKNHDEQAFFICLDTPLAGRGLVVGVDDEGADAEPISTLEDIQNLVTWTSITELRIKYASM